MNFFILAIIQIVIGIGLIVCVLLQQRGGGVGVLGGMQTQFYGTRRGLEKIIFGLTIALGVIFIITSVVALIIR
ncbi:MAG: preprotein translocase subunit SecG [Parcubacteria group bacterium]|nr:preprotein translocase subunit SecG [Parcubacteria group bacterium]